MERAQLKHTKADALNEREGGAQGLWGQAACVQHLPKRVQAKTDFKMRGLRSLV